MFAQRFLATAALIALIAVPAFAQAPTTTTPMRPMGMSPPPGAGAMAPSGTSSPMTSAGSKATHAATAIGSKVNLNTANAQELDALPGIGKARTKAILDERAKGKFKDWDDFDKRMAHTSVNTGVKSKIKDLVTF
jgi:competence protein ComEA